MEQWAQVDASAEGRMWEVERRVALRPDVETEGEMLRLVEKVWVVGTSEPRVG